MRAPCAGAGESVLGAKRLTPEALLSAGGARVLTDFPTMHAAIMEHARRGNRRALGASHSLRTLPCHHPPCDPHPVSRRIASCSTERRVSRCYGWEGAWRKSGVSLH